AYQQPVLYNLTVFREIVKPVYRTEGLSPPSVETERSVYKTLCSNAAPKAVSSGEVMRIGIYGLEAYGIFTVGEMIRRGSTVGY
ncbi:hypothetical protein GYMLUDRAFT_165006, partial [Collybiopsis luxurians FD-317 M1]